jgi:predicted nucleic acid-binding protein
VITYFETSAFVKLMIDEDGSDHAGILWDASDILVTSRLTYPESRAALAAAHRASRLSARRLRDAKGALETRFQEVDVVEVTDGVVRRAGDLCDSHALRGYDAVHLASALLIDTPDVVLATWDVELAEAARIVGLDVAGIQPK